MQTVIYVGFILVLVLFPVACIFFFGIGKFVGLKEGTAKIELVTKAFQDVFASLGKQESDKTDLYMRALALKDIVIASMTKEVNALRTALEEVNSMHEACLMDEDDEDEMVEEVGVSANKTLSVSGNASAATVALDLHSQLITASHTLEGLKETMKPDAYNLLKSILSLPKEKKYDVN
jgi:hypothetical protein